MRKWLKDIIEKTDWSKWIWFKETTKDTKG